MRSNFRIVVLGIATALGGLPAQGRGQQQGQWVPPQAPCDLPAGHFKVNGGLLYLRTAAQKPDQRDRQLAQAKQVLTEAILQNQQDKNPAAWYYLGRYYAEVLDAAGADTAFARAQALAPKCGADIGGYRREVWAKTVNNGLAAWQDGKTDSAVVLFHLAARLDTANPKPFTALAAMYAEKSNDDSALAYYRRAAAAAGSDTAFAQEKRDALGNAWRLVVRRVQDNPAARDIPTLRARLDSIQGGLDNDSTVLARLVASSQSRKARHRTLAPRDQRTFSQDSTARATAVTQARAARSATLERLAADNATLASAFAPAIDALREYLAVYPGASDAATSLATLLAQSGRPEQAAAALDSLSAHAPDLDPTELFGTGQRLVSQGYYVPGARALTLGLQRNPYQRDALYSLAVALYQARDSSGLLPAAQRLLALDPLNRNVLRLVAAGWDLRARRDSTLAYLRRADSTVAVDVTVSMFIPDSAGASLTALATNVKSSPSKAFRLSFEFLDAHGQVVATATQDVPPLPPQQSQEIDLKVSGRAIAGWRYRAS